MWATSAGVYCPKAMQRFVDLSFLARGNMSQLPLHKIKAVILFLIPRLSVLCMSEAEVLYLQQQKGVLYIYLRNTYRLKLKIVQFI